MEQFMDFDVEFNNTLLYLEHLLSSAWESQDKGAYDALSDAFRSIDILHQSWVDCVHVKN